MPNLIPGFIYQPISHEGRPKRRKGRGLVGHVAVSESTNLRPSGGADWHAYLPKIGPGIQYIDLDYVCYATLEGNPDMAAFESQGGVGTTQQVNDEPWNDNQLRLAATFLRHLHDTESVPLQVMPDSRPSSRGFGTHRLGIDPWRVAGGQSWSSSRGKLCPGDRKHEQRSEIVRLAAGGTQEDDLTPAESQMLKDIKAEVMAGRRQDYVVLSGKVALILAAVKESQGADIDEKALADALAPSVIAAIGESHGISAEDVESAIRRVLADAANG